MNIMITLDDRIVLDRTLKANQTNRLAFIVNAAMRRNPYFIISISPA